MAMPVASTETSSPSPNPTAIAQTALGGPMNLGAMLSVHTNLLQMALKENDKRLVVRVLHYLPNVRRQADYSLLHDILGIWNRTGGMAPGALIKSLLGQIPSGTGMETEDKPDANNGNNREEKDKFSQSPIGEIYISFLVALHLFDHQSTATLTSSLDKIFTIIIRSAEEINLRLLDPLLARLWYFYSRHAERTGCLSELHPTLMRAFRQSALRHELETHATLYNVLLRMFILASQFDLAQKLLSQAPFPGVANGTTQQKEFQTSNSTIANAPSTAVSGANQARFHYYVARLMAIQADYEGSKDNLLHALRKAPHGKVAAGFLQMLNKWLVIVQLLLGETPERSLFRQPMLVSALRPYLKLAQTVRLGDISRFRVVLTEISPTLMTDGVLPLAQRLHQNVLKAGLLRLNRAYHRITLAQVQQKLSLPSVEDAQFVLVKAIAEGIVHGKIETSSDNQMIEEPYFKSTNTTLPYYTTEPQEQLHQRIGLLNELYSQYLKAMRYSATDKDKKQLAKDFGPAPTEADLIDEYLDAEDFM